MRRISYLTALAASCLLASSAQAQTLIEGVYQSPAGENGRGACTLEVKSLGKSPKYGDDLYSMTSTGEGACEWTAIGLSRNFKISAGMVSSGGYDGFVSARWPFGPGGNQTELTSFTPDGAVATKINFIRLSGLEK